MESMFAIDCGFSHMEPFVSGGDCFSLGRLLSDDHWKMIFGTS